MDHIWQELFFFLIKMYFWLLFSNFQTAFYFQFSNTDMSSLIWQNIIQTQYEYSGTWKTNYVYIKYVSKKYRKNIEFKILGTYVHHDSNLRTFRV